MKPAYLPEAADSTSSDGSSSGRKSSNTVSTQPTRGNHRLSALVTTPRRCLIVGFTLLVLVAIGGAYFAFYPGPTPVDRLAFSIIPSEYTRHPLVYITYLGRPRVVAPGVVLCAFIAFFSDRRRALTCLAAPIVAILITEYLAKPAVGRMFGGSLCYPSGHMTSVAALICAFVIAVPPRWRTAAAIFGTVVGLIVGVTLMLLRWHYLTDVVAGGSVSIASTLIVDGLLHHRQPKHAWFKSA